MNAESTPAEKMIASIHRGHASFERQTGQSLKIWALIALFNFIGQIIFHRELAPGEFGALNTALGLIALMTVPLLALRQGITQYLAREHSAERCEYVTSLRGATYVFVETAAWTWGAIALVILFFLQTHLGLPRWSIFVFVLFNVLMSIGGVITTTLYQDTARLRFWIWLVFLTVLIRVSLGGYLGSRQPWAESVLIAYLISAFILVLPLVIRELVDWTARLRACGVALDGDFLLHVGATVSVVVALFLFTSTDRIVAQGWFGVVTTYNLGLVDWTAFDSYQTAGLLGRGLIWGLQPLLLLFYVQRASLKHTTHASLTFFWIYVGALIAGSIFLRICSVPLSALFCGDDYESTSSMIPAFAVIMVPIGLLQALGVFALASRRYPECFLLGGCGLGYFVLLFLYGRQPGLMLSYMFGGSFAAILIVLFIGIVLWGRKQP